MTVTEIATADAIAKTETAAPAVAEDVTVEAPAAPAPKAPKAPRAPKAEKLSPITPAISRSIPLSALVTDPRAQPRVSMDSALISEYAEEMAAGAVFPPVVAFGTLKSATVADGFHRVAAAREAGIQKIAVDLRKGGIDEAILHSLGANGAHGARRTNADKRNAVERALLLRPEATDGVIGDLCAVSARFVSNMRRVTQNGSESVVNRVGRDGRTINTAKIGTTRKAEPVAAEGPYSLDGTPKNLSTTPRRSSDPAIADDYAENVSQEEGAAGGYLCGDCGESCGPEGHDHQNAAAGAALIDPLIPNAAAAPTSEQADAAAAILADVAADTADPKAPTTGAVYDTLTRLARGIKAFPGLDPEAVAAESLNPAQALEAHSAALAFYGRFVAALNAQAKAAVKAQLAAVLE